MYLALPCFFFKTYFPEFSTVYRVVPGILDTVGRSRYIFSGISRRIRLFGVFNRFLPVLFSTLFSNGSTQGSRFRGCLLFFLLPSSFGRVFFFYSRQCFCFKKLFLHSARLTTFAHFIQFWQELMVRFIDKRVDDGLTSFTEIGCGHWFYGVYRVLPNFLNDRLRNLDLRQQNRKGVY